MTPLSISDSMLSARRWYSGPEPEERSGSQFVMVTIFYIAPRDESIHIEPAIGKILSRQGRMTMDTIETIRYARPAFRPETDTLAHRGFVGRMVVALCSIA